MPVEVELLSLPLLRLLSLRLCRGAGALSTPTPADRSPSAICTSLNVTLGTELSPPLDVVKPLPPLM
jgi:hypothetical protein